MALLETYSYWDHPNNGGAARRHENSQVPVREEREFNRVKLYFGLDIELKYVFALYRSTVRKK